MSELEKEKIRDVMHTLRCIQDGRAVNAKLSAKACHEVLERVLSGITACANCGKEAWLVCESCGATICDECEGGKYSDVYECANESKCSDRIAKAEPQQKRGEG